MSEDSDDIVPTSNPDVPAGPEAPLARRLFFFKAASVLGAVAAVTAGAAVVAPTAAQAQCTDSNPYDAPGYGRWCR